MKLFKVLGPLSSPAINQSSYVNILRKLIAVEHSQGKVNSLRCSKKNLIENANALGFRELTFRNYLLTCGNRACARDVIIF